MAESSRRYRPWKLRWDLAWARGLLWFARSGRGGREPRQEVHLYMYGRYRQLADYHAARGSRIKARKLSEKASWHLHQGGGDDSPEALAMAMPIPGPEPVDAVAREADRDDIA